MSPSALATTPVPVASTLFVPALSASMVTTDGARAA